MDKPVLITRPEEDATPLASRVAYLGGDPILCPLLTIRYLDVDIDLNGVQGLLFTSANGVRAFSRLTEERSLPAYAVGNATAEEAHKAGFETVKTAAGDVDALARLVIETCKSGDGELFHAAGSKLAGDLSGLLAASGFVTRRSALYEAVKADSLPDGAMDALTSDRQTIALFYSPRTARTFIELVENAGLNDRLGTVTALCLSQAVAEKIAPYQWAKVVVADKPEQDSLLGQLERILANDMADEKNQDAHEQEEHLTDAVDAEALIEAFGGIRPMANKLDVAVSTVQGWKLRNHIPPARLEDIEKAAQENGIDLTNIIRQADDAGSSTDPVQDEPSPETPSPQKTPEPAASVKEESATKETKTAPQPPAVSKGGSKVAWAALLASLAVGTALVLQPYWAPTVDQRLQPVLSKAAPAIFTTQKPEDTAQPGAEAADVAAQVEALQRQMDGLASAVSALEGQVAQGTGTQSGGTDMAETLEFLKERVTALEAAGTGAPTAGLVPLNERLAEIEAANEHAINQAADAREALQKAVDAQERQAGTLASRVTELSSRLQSMEAVLDAMAQEPAVRNQQEIALVVAAGQLEVQALDGRKFEDALTTFEALATDMPELDSAIAALKDSASTGVPTRTMLLQEFQKLAAKIDKPVKDAGEADWVDATLANLSGLVSIRRTGEAPDLPPMSRAEAALARDDLAGAVTVLKSLTDSRPDIAGWHKMAQRRLDVEDAIATLRADAAKRLSLASVTPDNTIARAAEDSITDAQTETAPATDDEASQ